MPVLTHSYVHFQTPPGPPPGSPAAPTAVTSITKDAGATVSFLPGNPGAGGAVTSWTVTPYIAGTAQAPQTVTAASATAITAWNGTVFRQAPVTGLANGTAYTFTVHGTNPAGAGAESAASAANTPYAGLMAGDDFNGPLNGAIDPEWWLLDVAQEGADQGYYRPDHVYLDGAGNLVLKATHDAYGGKAYTTGQIQNNTRSYLPAAGNTCTFETRAQIPSGVDAGMWPAPWLAGTDYQEQFKTDQQMTGWNDTGAAEIDIAEWMGTGTQSYLCNVYASATSQQSYNGSVNMTLAQHVYRCDYKPSARVSFWFDGSQVLTETTAKPSGPMFFMWTLQILGNPSPPVPQYCWIDYIRIYDRNLG